jgi:hypothetical protein
MVFLAFDGNKKNKKRVEEKNSNIVISYIKICRVLR